MALITENLNVASNDALITPEQLKEEMPLVGEAQDSVQRARNSVFSILDRKEAIKVACSLAISNDIILIAGKGHESFQEINGVKRKFDDFDVVKEILNNKK